MCAITFQHVFYEVNGRQLLRNVTGTIEEGHMQLHIEHWRN